MSVIVPLKKPLKTHDGEITQITLREMSATDIVTARVPPFKVVETNQGEEQHAEFRYDVIMNLAARLSGIDDLVLGGLSAKDFHAVANAVVKLWNASGE